MQAAAMISNALQNQNREKHKGNSQSGFQGGEANFFVFMLPCKGIDNK